MPENVATASPTIEPAASAPEPSPVETPAAPAAAPSVSAPKADMNAEDRALDMLEQATDENGQLDHGKLSELRTAGRDEKGRFAPKNEADTAETQNAPDAKTPPAATESAAREELVLAKQALRRDQWTEQELLDLPDDQIRKFGLKAKSRQDAQARKWASERSGKPTQTETATDGEEGLRTRPEPNRDIDADPEQSEGIEDVLDGLDEASSQKVKAQLRSAQQRAATAEREANVMRLLNVRQDLAKDFPDIASDEGFGRVVKAMDRIDPKGESFAQVETLRRVMRDASWIEFGEKVKSQTQRQNFAAATADLDGQPSVGSRRPADRTISRDEWEDAAAEAASSTSNIEDARRLQQKILAKRK